MNAPQVLINKFGMALRDNDIKKARRILGTVPRSGTAGYSHLYEYHLPAWLYEYVFSCVQNRTHPSDLAAFIKQMKRRFPTNFITLKAELIFMAQVEMDSIKAYLLIERAKADYATQIDDSFCQIAFFVCLSLKRFNEARAWIQRVKECSKQNDYRSHAIADMEANLLSREGKHEEALVNLTKRILTHPNKDALYFQLARNYFCLKEYSRAKEYAELSIQACADSMNYTQYALILFALGEYSACKEAAIKAKEDIEQEWGSMADNEYTGLLNRQASDLEYSYRAEAYKLLTKCALKQQDMDTARVYLATGKKIIPFTEVWQDIEDLWPEENNDFDVCLQDNLDMIKNRYPQIPSKAAWCIARADAISEFLTNPATWYDMICRDHGTAFEIILRDIVCKGSKSMELHELIDYISSRPGDPLYGGNELLHRLRKIRNNVSHEPVASAEDVERSRRILFEEVLAKL